MLSKIKKAANFVLAISIFPFSALYVITLFFSVALNAEKPNDETG
jgi:hypothetical protein